MTDAAKGRCNAPRQGEAGFSLVELLAALSILSLLAVALGGGLDFGRRVWERADAQAAIFEETTLTLDAVRFWLEGAYPLGDVTSDRRISLPLIGSEESVTFSAPLLQGGQDEGLHRIALYRQGNTLSISWAADRAGQIDPRDDDHAASRALISGVQALGLRYFEPGLSGAAGRWVETWANRKDIPRAVELTLEMLNGDTRTLVARTRVNRDANCRYDPVSRDCR